MEPKEYRKLHAEWYDLVSNSIDHTQEIDYWARAIERAGEPALELGSGTGRVLVPLLERGFNVVGIDTSPDMMARCHSTCEAKGLKVELHEQSMREFSLPREFGLIFLASGGLGLFTEDRDIEATFERVMAHLRPGGSFIYGFEPLRDACEDNDTWTGDWIGGSDDVVIAWRKQMRHDPATNVWKWLFIVEKFVGGRLVETEANERWGRNFTVDEARHYAEAAGFEDVRVTDWLSDDPPGKHPDVINVQCRKPAEGRHSVLDART